MKLIDPTHIHKHAPEILALAKNRSSAGLKLDVKAAKIAHSAALAAQKKLFGIIRDEAWQGTCDDQPAIREKYSLIAEVIDRNEREKHHRLTQLRQAVAAATERETGKRHWFGWHAGETNSDGTVNVDLGVRPL